MDTCGVHLGYSVGHRCLLPHPPTAPKPQCTCAPCSSVPCPTLGAPASGLPGSSGPLCSSHFRSMEKACMFTHWSSVKCWPVESTVKKSEATAPSTSVMGPGCGRKDRAGDEVAGLINYAEACSTCPPEAALQDASTSFIQAGLPQDLETHDTVSNADVCHAVYCRHRAGATQAEELGPARLTVPTPIPGRPSTLKLRQQ